MDEGYEAAVQADRQVIQCLLLSVRQHGHEVWRFRRRFAGCVPGRG
jgi:hypothetical protein